MATTVEELRAVLSADVSDLRREMSAAAKSVDILARATQRHINSSNGMATANTRAASSASKLRNTLSNLGKGIIVANQGFELLARVGRVASGLAHTADTATFLNARLRVATQATGNFNAVYSQLLNTANATGNSFESAIDLYARMERATRHLNIESSELVGVVDTINKALRVGGTTSREASQGLIQFAQGLASGRLNGDELRAVLEQMPLIAEALAVKLGVTVGALRDLGAAGKLTPQVILGALKDAKKEVDEQFNLIPATVEQAMARASNAWLRFVDIMNQSLGGAESVAGFLDDSFIPLTATVLRFSVDTGAAFAILGTGLGKVASDLFALGRAFVKVTTAINVAASNPKKAFKLAQEAFDEFEKDFTGFNADEQIHEILAFREAAVNGLELATSGTNAYQDKLRETKAALKTNTETVKELGTVTTAAGKTFALAGEEAVAAGKTVETSLGKIPAAAKKNFVKIAASAKTAASTMASTFVAGAGTVKDEILDIEDVFAEYEQRMRDRSNAMGSALSLAFFDAGQAAKNLGLDFDTLIDSTANFGKETQEQLSGLSIQVTDAAGNVKTKLGSAFKNVSEVSGVATDEIGEGLLSIIPAAKAAGTAIEELKAKKKELQTSIKNSQLKDEIKDLEAELKALTQKDWTVVVRMKRVGDGLSDADIKAGLADGSISAGALSGSGGGDSRHLTADAVDYLDRKENKFSEADIKANPLLEGFHKSGLDTKRQGVAFSFGGVIDEIRQLMVTDMKAAGEAMRNVLRGNTAILDQIGQDLFNNAGRVADPQGIGNALEKEIREIMKLAGQIAGAQLGRLDLTDIYASRPVSNDPLRPGQIDPASLRGGGHGAASRKSSGKGFGFGFGGGGSSGLDGLGVTSSSFDGFIGNLDTIVSDGVKPHSETEQFYNGVTRSLDDVARETRRTADGQERMISQFSGLNTSLKSSEFAAQIRREGESNLALTQGDFTASNGRGFPGTRQ